MNIGNDDETYEIEMEPIEEPVPAELPEETPDREMQPA